MLLNPTRKRDTIECVDNFADEFEPDIEFILVVLAASPTLVSRLPVENTKHCEICEMVMHPSTN